MTLQNKIFIPLLCLCLSCSQQLPQTEINRSESFDLVLRTASQNGFDAASYLSETAGGFPLSVAGQSAPILVSQHDYAGILKVAGHLQTDLANVTGNTPALYLDTIPQSKSIVIIGSIRESELISDLVEAGKLDVNDLKDKWEKFTIQTISDPFEGVKQALVIAGSDKRGTIYGMYDLAQEMGVSPWYWWADVPVKQHENIYVKPGKYSQGEPKVKYRGIFINDEAPALSGWAHEKFGGFNHHFYERVFELILRMKGNYLWPAMWGRAIYDDDPRSPELADEYGVVIGTSHHEPLMRAHVEWERYGSGPWNYEENEETLRAFWREGMERMGDNESLVTIGMRGDGDEPMTEGTAIALLERIVKDQREIIEEVTGKPAKETPQIWALYKEVQEYYDKGMRVPEDVTLLLCDDNWGNIRKLPQRGDTLRDGGYGIYYHYDYVGGPRNYKWINTNQISRVWEQMNLAYAYGAREVWIVNVGDIKPMEFPTSFFLDYAWNPEKIAAADLPAYGVNWAARQFGEQHAEAIAQLLHRYSQYNSRRKPELLAPDTYSLVNYREFEQVVEDYNALLRKAEEIAAVLPESYQSAYFQLVLFPIKASANLNEMYFATAKNRLYAAQQRSLTNELAGQVEQLFKKDEELTRQYHELREGKWNHMMAQTHIGYTYWQQPEEQKMPETETISIPQAGSFGLAVEGSANWWPQSRESAQLPDFNAYHDQEYFIEVYNRGVEPFDFQIESEDRVFSFSETAGTVEDQRRILVKVNWDEAADRQQGAFFVVAGESERIEVSANLQHVAPDDPEPGAFVESDGAIAFDAEDYSRSVGVGTIDWLTIPQLGRTRSAVTPVPVTVPAVSPAAEGPRLEYQIHVLTPGEAKVKAYFSPTLNFHDTEGFKYAISFDDEAPVTVNIHQDFSWEQAVSENIVVKESAHVLSEGAHTLKFWMIDPGLALQKIVVVTGEERESYLGAPSLSAR